MLKIIDARGISCPQPVLMTKKELDSQPKDIQVIVDNGAAKENVTRFAKNAGYEVEVITKEEDYILNIRK